MITVIFNLWQANGYLALTVVLGECLKYGIKTQGRNCVFLSFFQNIKCLSTIHCTGYCSEPRINNNSHNCRPVCLSPWQLIFAVLTEREVLSCGEQVHEGLPMHAPHVICPASDAFPSSPCPSSVNAATTAESAERISLWLLSC